MYRLIMMGVLLMSLTMSFTTVEAQSETPTVVNPAETSELCVGESWNLEVFPFWDDNENGISEPGERLISAQGTVSYGDPPQEVEWDSSNPPACISVQYGAAIKVEVKKSGSFQCTTPLFATMVESGKAYIAIPCHQNPLFNWLHHQWMGYILN